jgi:hypothetical protein
MRHDSRLWPGSGREGYGDQQTPDARRGRSRALARLFSLAHFLILGSDGKNYGIGMLVNGRDRVQEPAALFLVRMTDLLQSSEGKFHRFAAIQRRGHLIENQTENMNRPAARKTATINLVVNNLS